MASFFIRPLNFSTIKFGQRNGQYFATVPNAQVSVKQIPQERPKVILPRTEIVEPPTIRTAKNVATLQTLMKDTVNDLYGLHGTGGIAKWKRFPLLNDYLKGLRLGELTVLTGPTGSGKTTFLSEYSLDLAEQGVTTLWCNFELKNSRLCSMLIRQKYSTIAKPLRPNEVEQGAMERMIAKMHQEVPIWFTTFSGAANVTDVLSAIRGQHSIGAIQHVIIDNLQFMIGTTAAANPFAVQDSVFSQLRKLATDLNIHVTVVIHPRKHAHADCDQELNIHSLYGGVKASQEADNVLLIQVQRGQQDGFSKYLQIAKNRYFGDVYFGDRMLLTFYKDSQRHTLTWKKPEVLWSKQSRDVGQNGTGQKPNQTDQNSPKNALVK